MTFKVNIRRERRNKRMKGSEEIMTREKNKKNGGTRKRYDRREGGTERKKGVKTGWRENNREKTRKEMKKGK